MSSTPRSSRSSGSRPTSGERARNGRYPGGANASNATHTSTECAYFGPHTALLASKVRRIGSELNSTAVLNTPFAGLNGSGSVISCAR